MIVLESSGYITSVNTKNRRIKAVLQSFDVPNRNKRFYPLQKVKPAIEEFMEKVKEGEAFGELGHPENLSPERLAMIHPEHVSHIIKECTIENNLLKAVIEPTGPHGDNLMKLINSGKVGFSVRIFAQRWMRQESYMQPDGEMKIICYDAVIVPSHKEAYVEAVESTMVSDLEPAFEVACDGFCDIKMREMQSKGDINALRTKKLIKF